MTLSRVIAARSDGCFGSPQRYDDQIVHERRTTDEKKNFTQRRILMALTAQDSESDSRHHTLKIQKLLTELGDIVATPLTS
jgi:hypothetical protein